jgi:ribonuclease P protein component
MSLRFRPEQRLRRARDFRVVREQGHRVDCGAFLLTWAVRPATVSGAQPDHRRVGVVASRAAVGGAVERNRAKRRLREVYRRHQTLVPAGLDLVLTARPALLRLEFSEVEQKFVAACRKLAPKPIG